MEGVVRVALWVLASQLVASLRGGIGVISVRPDFASWKVAFGCFNLICNFCPQPQEIFARPCRLLPAISDFFFRGHEPWMLGPVRPRPQDPTRGGYPWTAFEGRFVPAL